MRAALEVPLLLEEGVLVLEGGGAAAALLTMALGVPLAVTGGVDALLLEGVGEVTALEGPLLDADAAEADALLLEGQGRSLQDPLLTTGTAEEDALQQVSLGLVLSPSPPFFELPSLLLPAA